MKSNVLFSSTSSFKFPRLFKGALVSFKRKKLLTHHLYGTSSKPVTSSLNSSKQSILNNLKLSTDGFMPTVWKSLAVASSLISNVTIRFSKSKTVGQSVTQPKQVQKSDEENINSKQVPKSDEENKNSTNAQDVHVKNTQPETESKSDNKDVVEQSFFEWLSGGDMQTKRKEFLDKDEKNSEKSKKITISKSSLQQRSRFLVHSLLQAQSSASQLLRLEEISKHLLLYPYQKNEIYKAGLVRTALRLKCYSGDAAVQAQARVVLALVGFHDPPRGNGIRILSIDGGGTRGLVAIEVLRQLEAQTNKKVYELFDYICGVSSGAILGLLLGGLRFSLEECEAIYRRLSNEIFKQSSIYESIWGAGRLMWSHAYYDTTMWVNVLKKTFGEKLIIEISKDEGSPKIGIVSAIMNLPQLQGYVFRNYDFPPRVLSHYLGSCKYRMWESIRATGAAPGYFEEYSLDEYLHQDGGVMINNTAALGIHEAKLIWPSDYIQCVVSLGTGRYIPPIASPLTSTSLKTKVLKIIDSATDTEAVHITLHDLLSPDTYFRINPFLSEFLTLDENRPEKLDVMKSDAQMYLRRNEYKFLNMVQTLGQPRSHTKKARDWIRVQKELYL